MRKIRDVLRYRHSAGLSLEAIAGALKISKGVVAKYLRLATVAGLTWPIPEALDDVGAGEVALPAEALPASRPLPNPTTRWCIKN
jgi:transcriptional regulator with XRE-family HTH domain